MSKILIFSLFVTSFIPACCRAQRAGDSLLDHWNRATLSSIARQEVLADSGTQRALYTNRKMAFQSSSTVSLRVKEKSTRIVFINSVISKMPDRDTVAYVIESDKSGYMYVFRNFLILFDSSNAAMIYQYVFTDNKWNIIDKHSIRNPLINDDFKTNIRTLWTGFNQDDIIISKFVYKRLVLSEYYLNYTLSKDCFIKTVIDKFEKNVQGEKQ